jgi:hypothetical protein
MNPITRLINFQRFWTSPAIFSAIAGALAGKAISGLFGSKKPDAPTLGSTMPRSTGSTTPLFNSNYSFDPVNRVGTGTVGFTPQGQGIADNYQDTYDNSLLAYNDFNIGDYATDQYGLMKGILDRNENSNLNRLLEVQNAASGGVNVTSSQRDMSSKMLAEQEFNRATNILNLLQSGEKREGDLYTRQASSGADLINYSNMGTGQLNNDMTQFNQLTKSVDKARQAQYQSEMQDFNDNQSFWNDFGGMVNEGITDFDFGSLFGGGSTPFIGGSQSNPNYGTTGNYLARSPYATTGGSVGSSTYAGSRNGGYFMGTQYNG